MAFGTESGFPKFLLKKYLGGDSVSGKAVHVWHFFSKNLFSQNDLPDLDSLVQIKNRDTNRVRAVARSPAGLLLFLATLLGKLENLTRTHDICF